MAVAKPRNTRSVRGSHASPRASTSTVDHTTELHTISSEPAVSPAEEIDITPPAHAADEPEALDHAELGPDLGADPLATIPTGDDPELAALAVDPSLDEEELVEDLDTVVVVEEEEEEEDDALPPPSNRVAPRMPGHMPGVPNRPVMHARMPAKAEIFHEGDHVGVSNPWRGQGGADCD